MTVGKNPHRPEGKADTDNPHMQAAWMNEGPPHNAPRNEKAEADRDRATQMRMQGGPLENFDEQDQVGGSRPGVKSRVKEAIERQASRDAADEA